MTTSPKTSVVERDCIWEHEGRTYEAGGALVCDGYARAYLAQSAGRLVVTTWHGEELGPATIVSSWRNPWGWRSDRIYQVRATINGRTYSGRGCGVGQVWYGRALKH